MKINDVEIPVSEALDFLASCKGKVITNLYRANHVAFDDEDDFKPFGKTENFSVAYGAFLVELDNDILFGIGSQDSLASLTIWLERDATGHSSTYNTLQDPDLFVIDAKKTSFVDPEISKFIEQKISSFQIFKRKPRDSRYTSLPNDCILLIRTDSNQELIIVLGLAKCLEDIAVIVKEDLPQEAWELIEKVIDI